MRGKCLGATLLAPGASADTPVRILKAAAVCFGIVLSASFILGTRRVVGRRALRREDRRADLACRRDSRSEMGRSALRSLHQARTHERWPCRPWPTGDQQSWRWCSCASAHGKEYLASRDPVSGTVGRRAIGSLCRYAAARGSPGALRRAVTTSCQSSVYRA